MPIKRKRSKRERSSGGGGALTTEEDYFLHCRFREICLSLYFLSDYRRGLKENASPYYEISTPLNVTRFCAAR